MVYHVLLLLKPLNTTKLTAMNINGIVHKFNEMTSIIKVHQEGLRMGLDKDNPDFFTDYLANLKRCSDKIVEYFAEGKIS